MDPVTVAFATFLNGLVQSYASAVAASVTDAMGMEMQSQVVAYQDRQITYQYQRWRLRHDSVCVNLRENLLEFSQCTVAAKEMFAETCSYLQDNPSEHARYARLKNLYCNAAVEFKPTIASVSDAPETVDELTSLRQECNLATAEAMGSTDAVLVKKRDTACAAYRKLKQSGAP